MSQLKIYPKCPYCGVKHTMALDPVRGPGATKIICKNKECAHEFAITYSFRALGRTYRMPDDGNPEIQ